VGVNLATLLHEGARRHGAREALVLGDRRLSYAELNDDADRLAAHLAESGLRPGDRVGVMLPNAPEFAISYHGALKAGGTVVPMNTLLKEREVAYHLKDAGASALICSADAAAAGLAGARDAGVKHVLVAGDQPVAGAESFSAALGAASPDRGRLVQRDPGDPAVILYTSGTTGRPKGALLTHSSLLWNAQISSQLFALTADDALLGTLPFFHSFGQTCVLNASLRVGATVVLIPRFDAKAALDLIEREAVTVFAGVPTMYVAMLEADRGGRELSSLRLCVSGGAAIAGEVLRAFEQRFGARILEGYGLSETSPVVSFNHLDRPSKPGSIGTPVWGVEMRLGAADGSDTPDGQVGEILVRGHNLMAGYHQRPKETRAAIDPDGWLRTGDLARRDEDGFYFIVDRKKELIIRGGYNVYPREIEEVLYEHPDILEAAVFGLPDETLGEEVAAAVAPRAGRTLDADEVRQFCKDRVAAYKYPRHVAVLGELPKTATGKILKRDIDRSVFEAASETA
jgi:long-chain acyl-CoA synthetase